MRKKFLAIYALVGALVASPIFTSCVDNEEAPSVSAVRGAKAEQLKALAALQTAEADLMKAETAYNQALADKTASEAIKAKAEAEEAIAKAKSQVAYYTQQLYNHQDAILTELTGNYTYALYDIATESQNLLNSKTDLANLEADLISAQAYTKQRTLEINNEIAAKKAAIELLKNTDANDADALDAQLEELKNKKEAAANAYNTLVSQYGSTDAYRHHWPVDPWNYWSDYDNNPTKLATVEAARGLHKLAVQLNYDNGATNPNTHPNNVTSGKDSYEFLNEDANGYLTLKEADILKYQAAMSVANSNYWETDLAVNLAKLGTEADKKDATYYDESAQANVPTLYAQLAAAQETFAAAEKAYNEKNDALAKAQKAAADAQTALDAENAKDTPDAAKVTELTAAKATADQAVTDATTAFTQAIKDAYKDADAVLNGGTKADGTVITVGAEMAIANAKDYIVDVEKSLADSKEAETNFDKWVAAFSGEEYDAYKAAVDALAAADEAKNLADAEFNEITSLKNILEGYSAETLAEKIAEYETDLAELEASLKQIKYLANNYQGSVEYREAAIAVAKEEIACYEAKLAAAKVRAEHAKAAMDAYLGTSEDDATTEEEA